MMLRAIAEVLFLDDSRGSSAGLLSARENDNIIVNGCYMIVSNRAGRARWKKPAGTAEAR
jgi:hypothetical protein